MGDTAPKGILNGLRVLDLSRMICGPYCTMMLADHGAEVIKIESGGGDTNRGNGPWRDDDPLQEWAGYCVNLNRRKKSVALDLETEEGKAALRALAATSDVLVENFHPGVMDRLGLSYESLAGINPALVYAAIRESNDPKSREHGDVQATGGMTTAFAIMAALRHVQRTGRGQVVEVATDDSIRSIFEAARSRQEDAINPVRFTASPMPPPAMSPRIGEHTSFYLSEMPPVATSEADKRALRETLGSFATGVTVITAREDDGTPRGFTANSFTSVSLDPPMVLVCIARTALSLPVFTSAAHFAVNILSDQQKEVSGLFASSEPEKFSRVEWQAGTAGMPLLEHTLASLVCRRENIIDAGDHVILLGRVIDHRALAAQPLGYFRGSYFSLGLEQSLIDAASESHDIEVGALIARGSQLLLTKFPDGRIGVPKARGKAPSLEGIKAGLRRAGLIVHLDFLYAVYRDSATGRHAIFHHGFADGLAPPGHRFVDLEDIEFDKIDSAAERSMLRRYAEEARHGSFGIYQGDETRGVVHRVSSFEPSKH